MLLLATAALLVLVGLAHSVLGERYILTRLFRRPLPPLFGSDAFTKGTLRFAWHITTIAWFGFAALLVNDFASRGSSLRIVSVTFLATGLVALVASRGTHLSWIVFLAIAALTCWPTWRCS